MLLVCGNRRDLLSFISLFTLISCMYGLILQYDIKWTTVYLGRLRGVGVIENLATGILHHEMFWTRKKVNDVSHCYVSMLMGVVNNSSTKIGL